MRMPRLLLIPLFAAATSACGLLYTDVKAPRAYRSATPSDVKAASDDPVVTGQSCSQSVLWLVAWGDTSYNSALKDAVKGKDGILYDVRSDVKVNGYALGMYTKVCTVLTGKLAKP